MSTIFNKMLGWLFPVRIYISKEEMSQNWLKYEVVNQLDPYTSPVQSLVGKTKLGPKFNGGPNECLAFYDLGRVIEE